MVTISITHAAFDAIAATLPKGYRAIRRPDGRGGLSITLPRPVLEQLERLRGDVESYSDVILRAAKELA